MDTEEIIIEKISVKDLPAFADRCIEGAVPGKYIGITRHRAIALAENPMASPDDVGMLVAYRGEELMGYFGVMPIVLTYGGEHHKVQWFTTWSVSPSARGKGLGSALMKTALAENHDYMIVGSAPARGVCKKFGFKALPPLPIAYLDIHSISQVNPVTVSLRLFRKVFNLFGGKLDINQASTKANQMVANWFGRWIRPRVYADLRKQFPKMPENLILRRVEQVTEIESGTPDSVKGYFSRSTAVVNWMLKLPWVAAPGTSESEGLDYYFTDVRPGFEYLAYEIYEKDAAGLETYQGYVVCLYHQLGQRKSLRVLDVKLLSAYQQYLPAIVFELAQARAVDAIELNAAYVASLQGQKMYEARERVYQCYPKAEDSPLSQAWQDMVLDMPDGDMAFT